MFAIILSILLVTNILAAPIQTITEPPWINMKNEKSLERFQSTLLNSTLLPFLDGCYERKTSDISDLCSRYFDGILQLNSTDYVVAKPTIEKLLTESNKNFCKENQTVPDIKYYPSVPQNFSDPVACGYLCTELKHNEFVPKPICTFIAWMGKELKTAGSSDVPPGPLSASNAAILESGKNTVTVMAINSTTAAEGHSNSGVPDPGAPRLETPIVPKPSGSKDELAEQSSKKNEEKTISQQKVDSVQPTDNRPPVKVTTRLDTAIKEEKKVSLVVKEKQEVVSPTLSTNTQEGEIPSKVQAAASPEKHDQLSIDPNDDQPNDLDSEADANEDVNLEDTDDEGEDFGVNQPKLPKDPPLAGPDDNEVDQKNSQEIIDGNYLSNINRVTDPFLEESGSNFFTYFLIGMFLCIVLYIVYHNKSKILALLLEGRRSDKGRGGRRKHTAAYRKLDSNLEEAITSSASGRTTQIIY